MDSADPEDPQTWNRYAYTLNNPLKFVDPDGRQIAVRTEVIEAQIKLHEELIDSVPFLPDFAKSAIKFLFIPGDAKEGALATLPFPSPLGMARRTGLGFEKLVARKLGRSGDEIVAIGDNSVRKFLGLGSNDKSVDILTRTSKGLLKLTEVKIGRNVEVSDLLEKFNTVARAALEKGERLGELVVELDKGFRISGGSVSKEGFLLDQSGKRVIAFGGKAIRVEFQ